MLIAFISDVHGNGPALEEVVEKISTLRPDTVICLGDVVGYGPHVQRAVNLVQATTDVYLRGNHEDMLIHPAKKIRANLNAREAIEYSDKQLRTPAQRDFLRLLPTEYVEEVTVLEGAFNVYVDDKPLGVFRKYSKFKGDGEKLGLVVSEPSFYICEYLARN